MKKKEKVIFGICLALFLGAGAFAAAYYMSVRQNEKVYERMAEEAAAVTVSPAPPLEAAGQNDGEKMQKQQEDNETDSVQIPIDFASLQAENPDIYAWIRIPGTKVDYPVLQREGDDGYYLNRTVEGVQGLPGSLYTESCSSRDFTDCNTVIYGHNMRDGSMFGGLDAYADQEYMEEYGQILIYTPQHQYTYQIFAAVTYDNRHILWTYDGKDRIQLQAFLDSLRQGGFSGTWNEQLQATGDDRILTLSTCNGNDRQRFLVEAVLIDEK